jgi:hypothetical protein
MKMGNLGLGISGTKWVSSRSQNSFQASHRFTIRLTLSVSVSKIEGGFSEAYTKKNE